MALINGNTGDACFAGKITSGRGCDFAELFETLDGKPIDVGYFVTTKGKKIRKATDRDNYILGVTSAVPTVLQKLNPEYDPDKQYIPRSERPEWEVVG
ncbi:peptidase G2 autoproteolytic cleavage domain-containing protein [Chengkuizengella sp. SCS-71B]|uniref:peptidase G2 autoproteolytic cleavage domain-containing protein n=1 Tax=Chengkuizengella sp. SCS-71B TaxID=3115290 RepID=UPI0032C24059